MARDICCTPLLTQPYGDSFFIPAFPNGCGSALSKPMSITIRLLVAHFDDMLSWPFKGTIQISIFR